MSDLENKIKEVENFYEIKTTSSDILEKICIDKKSVKSKSKFIFKPLFVTLAFVAIAVLCFIPILLKDGDQEKVEIRNQGSSLTDTSLLSTVSFQLFYSGEVLSLNDNQNIYSFKMMSEDDFSIIKGKYDKINPLIQDLFRNQAGIESYYKEVDFTYEGKRYNYQLTVDQYVMYLESNIQDSDEIEVNMLLNIEQEYYNGKIEIERDGDETEISLTYQVGDYSYEIERNYEKQEFSMAHTTYYKSKEVNSFEVELEYEDNELICTYEYESDSEEFEYEVRKISNDKFVIHYESDDEECDFSLQIIDGQNEYILLNNNKNKIL